jgi:hypothetical protein
VLVAGDIKKLRDADLFSADSIIMTAKKDLVKVTHRSG